MRKKTKKTRMAAGAALALALLVYGCNTNIAMPTNRYAVLIGVQDYPGDSNDLSYTENDANDMEILLKASSWTIEKKLLSADATRAGIESAIADLGQRVGSDANATVLVYFSGHGSSISVKGVDTGYIVPWDGLASTGQAWYGGTDEATSVVANWITPAEMTQWLDTVACRNKLLILDSCFSGSFVDAGSSIDVSPQDSNTSTGTAEASILATAVANLGSLLAKSLETGGAPGVTTISASGSEEESYDDLDHKNGAFTYYLLKSGLAGDRNGDGYVTATEALDYSKTMLKANWNPSRAWSGEALLPHISGGAGDIVLFTTK
jgi:uncharacterized caspase-like protein